MTDDVAELFLQEAGELLEQLELSLLDLEGSPDDKDLIDKAFRALHTIKGSGAMFGFDQVAAFIHEFETAFDRIRKGQTKASRELIEVALVAKDHIRVLIEAPDEADVAHGDSVLAKLRRVTKTEAHAAPEEAPAEVQDEAPAATTWQIGIAFNPDILANGTNPLLLLDELRGLGTCYIDVDASSVPALHELNAQDLHLRWNARLTMAHERAAVEEVFIFVLDEMKLDAVEVEHDGTFVPSAATSKPSAAAAAPTDAAPAETAAAATRMPDSAGRREADGPRAGGKESSTIRVPAERLDEMMDRVGELVIAQARLTQIAAASGAGSTKAVAEDIERLTSALRDAMMGIRMVPIGSLFGRFRRLVHDLSRDLGKSIELVTEGEETELDKTMIERLADPLVHVIRNSADHGLESPAVRTAAGKDATGRIKLVARHAGAEVLISVSDDGRGLDTKRIRAKAEENGLLAPGAVISDMDLNHLIFHPGFSTAKEISALSGRGVGMDVVKRTVEGMRGSIDVATDAGRGSQITLRLPLTLAIIEGLLVRVAEGRYVIPLTAVEECVELSASDDTRSQGRSFLNIRGELVPFLRLRDLFDERGAPDVHQKVVIVAAGDTRVGLVVDQIIGSHQTVIKSLSKLHADVPSFSGATILGDGTVALILDILHLVARGQAREARTRASSLELA